MTGTDEVRVDLWALRAHRDSIRHLATSLAEAVTVINQVSAPTDAYGFLCSPLLRDHLSRVQADAADGVAKMADLMDATADNLETTTVTYETADLGASSTLQRATSSATGTGAP